MADYEHDDLDFETDNFYAWLGLNCKATVEEINNAYRQLSKIYHPDKHATDPQKQQDAQILFTKIKRAHEVLSNPEKRAIYDTMGIKGLETEGWELVPRTQTPQEIMEEYERLKHEREERRLKQQTNPAGTIRVSVDATDLFDSYDYLDFRDSWLDNFFPHIEISSMAVDQTVEAPLTVRDTAILHGSLTSSQGKGQGNIGATLRHLVGDNSWLEMDLNVGETGGLGFRGFRNLWNRARGSLSGSMQVTPKGLRPNYTANISQQLDKNLQGSLTLDKSSIQSMLVYNTERHHLVCALQLGIQNSFVMSMYTHRFPEQKGKVKASLRAGTFGVIMEYGGEKKISQFSVLGAYLTIGTPIGVILKIKLNRGHQVFLFPITLSEYVVPSAIFYGTVTPLLTYLVVKKLIVDPFVKSEKKSKLDSQKMKNAEKMARKKREAESAVELMKQTVERSFENETRKGGLVIEKAVYGKLSTESEIENKNFIFVTRPLQALVKDSKLFIHEATVMSELPGFYDCCVGEEKELRITYQFNRRSHQCTFGEKEKILIPNRGHLLTVPPSGGDVESDSDGLMASSPT